MSGFRFVHTSDLHLGRRFGTLPEEIRGRLSEARHAVIGTLAATAASHGAEHVLVAGDIFDTETPAEPVWRQALSAMAAAPGVHWWLLPGNHDSLAAETLWERIGARAPANVTALIDGHPVEIAPGVSLLPAPCTRRYPGRDLTEGMDTVATPPGHLRIGLAHGSVRDFAAADTGHTATIAPDRDRQAGLDYLALGDWHGRLAVSPRCHYSGTPEMDRFRHDGRGGCLAVTLPGAGTVPAVERVDTGRLVWAARGVGLLPGQDASQALGAALPADRAGWRDTLIRVAAEGRAALGQHEALRRAADELAPEFCHFALDTDALAVEVEAGDLDAIDRSGALRLAAERLQREAADETRDGADRAIAAAALNRLYAYATEDGA